jgi:hypothetical protein
MTAELNSKPGDNITPIRPLAAQKELRCRGCKASISRIKRGPFVKTDK